MVGVTSCLEVRVLDQSGRCLVCTRVSISLGPVIGRSVGACCQSLSSFGSCLILCHACLILRLIYVCCGWNGMGRLSPRRSWFCFLGLSMSSDALGILSALSTCWWMSLMGYPLAMNICLSVLISCPRCFLLEIILLYLSACEYMMPLFTWSGCLDV